MAAQIRFLDLPVMFIYLNQRKPFRNLARFHWFLAKSVQGFGFQMTLGCSNQNSENKVVSVINNRGTNDVHTRSFETIRN
jgi:hypothetical protein